MCIFAAIMSEFFSPCSSSSASASASSSTAIIIFSYFILTTLSGMSSAAAAVIRRHIDRDAQTIYYQNRPPNARGDFHFEFQTTNGITTKGAGNEFGFSGVVQYVSLEGIPVTMTYIADEDGYHPMGEHIHPIPEYVKRSLDYIRTHPMIDEKASRSL